MARHKKHPAHENHERWLVSYADFITLLFAFFVVMFASSQADKSKAAQMSAAVTEALADSGTAGIVAKVAAVLGGTVDNVGQGNAQMKGPGGAVKATENPPPPIVLELIPSLKQLTNQLQKEIKEGKLEINLEPRGLVVSLRQAVFFPSGENVIAPSTYEIMEKIAATINSCGNRVRLEGHTDSVAISTARYPSNWELSAARAIALLRVLSDRYQVDQKRFSVTGYADSVPIASNDTAEGRAKNRRVDVVILSEYALKASAEGQGEPAPGGHGAPAEAHGTPPAEGHGAPAETQGPADGHAAAPVADAPAPAANSGHH